MSEELQIVIRRQRYGREATPWLEPQRERFTRVAKEVAVELRNSKLKGAAKIRAMNARMSQKLKGVD